MSELVETKDRADTAHEITACVACGNQTLTCVLDLDKQPLANGFHEPGNPPPTYPLALRKCSLCHHCQLSHSVDPKVMFKHYLYVSGTSATARTYFAEFAAEVSSATSKRHDLGPSRPSVLDIASNDGSQLDAFQKLGWDTFGVDPAENLAPVAKAKGHAVTTAFWNLQTARTLGRRDFDVIVAQNVLAHVPDPYNFMLGIAAVCKPETDVYVQTSQMDMLFRGEFDTMYSEHISFFCVRSMQTLGLRAGLVLEDVKRVDLHGGSAVFRFRLNPHTSVNAALVAEEEKGLSAVTTVTQFAETFEYTKRMLHHISDYAKEQHYRLVGFGAAAKAMTVLCAVNLRLEYIVDDNPLKQGLLSPGLDIPVVSSQVLQKDVQPLIIIVLAWNFLPEIMGKLRQLRASASKDLILKKYIFSSQGRGGGAPGGGGHVLPIASDMLSPLFVSSSSA